MFAGEVVVSLVGTAAGSLCRAAVLLAPVVACASVGALPRAPSSEPQPRVVYDMHSARINQIRATPDGTRVLSVSEDKTVRVWRMADLALMRTLRTPSENGPEGAVRALATLPDSEAVIVGGWTGWAWSGRAHLYRFDLATGQMATLPASFASLIDSLGISRDGRWLAVGLEQGGLRVIDLQTGREALERADPEYAGAVRFVEFGPDGKLATTSRDGCLRLYASDGRRIFRNQYFAAGQPASGRVCTGSAMGGVRFSPDGKRLAWGENERAEVVVMRLDGNIIERVITSDDPQQRSLCCPIFSADGRHLYYHGAYEGQGATPLFRVDLDKPPHLPQRLDVGRQRFTNVLPLPGGDVVFSTNAPSLVRIAADGQVLASAQPPNVDFRIEADRFLLSADGMRVAFPREGPLGPMWVFEPAAGPSHALRPWTESEGSGLVPASRSAIRLRLDAALDEFSHLQPRSIAGHALPLAGNQATRSWAGHASLPVVAVGTQWSVLLADERAKVLWERSLPAPALHVAISADGRWVVAAVGDGSLRWYSLQQGNEVLGAFVHQQQPEWVAWREDGHYTSSPLGDQFFGWHLNRGTDEQPDLIRAVQMERQLFRPDLIEVALRPTGLARRRVSTADLQQALASAAVPRVWIRSARETDRRTVELRVQVEAAARAVEELGIFVDGLPVLPADRRRLTVPAQGRTELNFEVPRLIEGGRLRVEVETAASIGFDETVALHVATKNAAPRRGRIWAVLVGVSEFDLLGKGAALPGARNDVTALATTLRKVVGERAAVAGGAQEIHLRLLSEDSAQKPTKESILKALADVAGQAQPEDTLLLFVASHGMPDAGEYYIATKDSLTVDVALIDTASRSGERVAKGTVPSVISGTELVESLRRIPGRRIVILDTCFAGLASSGADPFVLVKRSASAQVAVLSAASGNEYSLESPELGHGVFTYMLMRALRGEIGPATGPITLRALFDAVKPAVIAEVRRLRNAQTTAAARQAIGSQTPMMTAIPILESTVFFPSAR